MRLLNMFAATFLVAACGRDVARLVTPGESAVALTGGMNSSMIYVARTRDGVVAIDLGWWGYQRALRSATRELGATASDISMVFLTHSHRDHIAAWPAVRRARIHIAEPDRDVLIGREQHRAWIPRLADRVLPDHLPTPAEIDLRTFGSDTSFIIGTDTLRAFIVPGHTPGTVVYLFRGILFVGDAVTFTRWSGFAPAKRGFSDDRPLAAASLEKLWARLPPGAARYVCTAHAYCAPFDRRFLDDVAR